MHFFVTLSRTLWTNVGNGIPFKQIFSKFQDSFHKHSSQCVYSITCTSLHSNVCKYNFIVHDTFISFDSITPNELKEIESGPIQISSLRSPSSPLNGFKFTVSLPIRFFYLVPYSTDRFQFLTDAVFTDVNGTEFDTTLCATSMWI